MDSVLQIRDFPVKIQKDILRFIDKMMKPLTEEAKKGHKDLKTLDDEHHLKIDIVKDHLPTKLSQKIQDKIQGLVVDDRKEILDERISDYLLAKDVIFWLTIMLEAKMIGRSPKLLNYLNRRKKYVLEKLDEIIENN